MAVVISKVWNTDENYWAMNPIMKTIKIFNDLFESDKSKGKTSSSKLMWAIALYIDPSEYNPWRTTSNDDKKELIATDYLKNPSFNWEDPEILSLLDAYEDKCLTLAEKELVRFEKKLSQRGAFIDRTDYSLDEYNEETGKIVKGTADQLDKMMVNTSKIYDQLKLISAMFSKETGGHLKGDSKESASEKQLL